MTTVAVVRVSDTIHVDQPSFHIHRTSKNIKGMFFFPFKTVTNLFLER